MTVVPNPDPTSRFPTAYCLTCGIGWTVTRCGKGYDRLKDERCDMSGEVPMTPAIAAIAEAFKRGECEAGCRKLPVRGAELTVIAYDEIAVITPAVAAKIITLSNPSPAPDWRWLAPPKPPVASPQPWPVTIPAEPPRPWPSAGAWKGRDG
jgi:hypothetical protein